MYYSCKGVRRGTLGELCTSAAFTLGVVFAALAAVYPIAERLMLVLAASSILLGVMLLMRYCLTEYIYTLEGDMLTVTERRGRRIRVTSRLRLSDIHTAVCVKGRGYRISKGNIRIYDYRPALLPSDFAAITVTAPDLCEGRERIVILLSPDQKMLHLLGM